MDTPDLWTRRCSGPGDLLRARYQQGANTVEAMDAAGLVQLVFRVVGRGLPRGLDALQRAGQSVRRDQICAGDVASFARSTKPGRMRSYFWMLPAGSVTG
jgi:cell wall-associated NlpC family hydrolase